MSVPAPKLFLTGDPGCGKTTAILRVVEALKGAVPMTGFVTEEIRGRGGREGFRGVTLDGRTFILAHVESRSEFRVGRYGVETEGLEQWGVPALEPRAETALVVLDEVGKMESASTRFRAAVEALLEADVAVLATIAAHGVGFVKHVRHDPRVTLMKMTRASRDAVVGEILRRLAAAGVGREAGVGS